ETWLRRPAAEVAWKNHGVGPADSGRPQIVFKSICGRPESAGNSYQLPANTLRHPTPKREICGEAVAPRRRGACGASPQGELQCPTVEDGASFGSQPVALVDAN